MNTDNVPTLVLGEAPESDDECDFEGIPSENINFEEPSQIMKTSASGSEILTQAAESDEEVVFHNTSSTSSKSSETNLPRIEKDFPPSVKKLYQKNKELRNSLASFKKQIFSSTKYELNNVNQQLLKSQIELQQILMNLRISKNNLTDYKEKLDQIIVANYIPIINIQIPKQII